MEKLNELFSKICSASERGKKGVLVDLQTISEIRDEYCSLEQRAEAAEKLRDRRIADYKHLVEQHMPRTSDGCDEGWSRVIEARELQVKLEAAEAKLAELEKQEPAAFTSEHYWSELNTFGAVKGVLLKNGNHPDFQVELFTRPAPAADLTELVPDKWYFQLTFDIPNLENMTPYQAHGAAWEQCRTAILLKIEEAK